MRMNRPGARGRGLSITAGGRREGFTARPACVGLRAGMTLVELLVAMTILLVGVWAVAKGFPALMGAITADQQRTQFARMIEGRMEALRQSAWALPQALVMYPLDQAASLDPDSKPRDPDTYDPNNPNSRDDLTVVLGEWGKIPAPQTDSPYVFMPVAQGLLDTDPARQGPVFACFIAERLEPLGYLPPGGTLPAGRFFLDWAGSDAGQIWLPAGYDAVRVDYGWVDTAGTTHWVQGDVVLVGGATNVSVSAKSAPAFASVLPSPARCVGLKAVNLVAGTQPNPREVCIEPTCGAGLIFNAAHAGQTVLVSYRLRCNPDGSRALYLMEEYNMAEAAAEPVSGEPDNRWVTVHLGWGGLDKLMDITEGSQTTQVHVLAVDEAGGNVYYDGTGVEPPDPEALRTGQVRLKVPTKALGHKFRFFYKTLDQAAIVVSKPPTIFYESGLPSLAALPFQTYATTASGAGVTSLRFSASNLGHTVAVDYVYDADPAPGAVRPVMVCGELHTLGPSSTGAEAVCSLSHPNVLEIRAVRGVSVRLRAWWRTPTGRLATYELESILPPAEAI